MTNGFSAPGTWLGPYSGSRQVTKVVDGDKTLEVPGFCYLGDILSSSGGYEGAIINRCKAARGCFS